MYRFFTPQDFYVGRSITLEKEELHHLKHVMRVKEGSVIELVNGKGDLATALLTSNLIISEVTSVAPPKYKSVLIQALPEPQHLELIIEKGSELGITDFWIFIGEKSKRDSISQSKQERLHKILHASLKQSKRLHLPTLTIYPSIKDLPKTLTSVFIADPRSTTPPSFPPSDRGIIVGPESGLTEKEVIFLEDHLQAKRISLSPNILRVETAAIIAAYLVAQVT